MDWKFWKKPKEVELQLYDSFAKPTKILKQGKPADRREADEIKEHFLKVDGAYDGLLKKLFEARGGIDQLDEKAHLRDGGLLQWGEGFAFGVTKGVTEMTVLHNYHVIDSLKFSVNGDTYEFSMDDPLISGNDFGSPWKKGDYYAFRGKMNEKDYAGLVVPNSPVGTDTLINEPKKFCWRREDGYCYATVDAKIVPELIKKVLSCADASGGPK